MTSSARNKAATQLDAWQAEEQFRDAARAAGIELPLKIDSDEKWRHVSKKSPQSYFFGKDTKGKWWGGWQDWSLTGEPTYWHPRGDCVPLTAAEKIQRQQDWAAEKKRRDAKKAKDVKAALKRDNAAWDVATPAPDDHPYLLKKGVKAHGLHINAAGELLVPVRGASKALQGLQRIIGDGTDEKPFEKLFTANTNPTGRFHTIGDIDPDGTILIAEGYATAASCHEATGKPCIVAFNCHNLLPVAEAIAKAYPKAQLALCADDDTWTPEGPGHPENPGLTLATEAAKAVGGYLAIPRWPGERPFKHTDFNDLAADENLDAVKRCIEAARPVLEKLPALVARLADIPEAEWLSEAKALAKAAGTNQATLVRLVKDRCKSNRKQVAKVPRTAAPGGGEKLVIQLEAGKLDVIVKQAMDALVEKEADIFQRNGRLVRPVLGRGTDTKGRLVQFMTIIEIDAPFLCVELSRYIDWVKWDDRKKEMIPATVTVSIALSIISSAGNWPFRVLAGAISAPTLRHNGSILRENGYDPQTYLYLKSDIELPEIPEPPSKEDAEEALRLIEDLFVEFPFTNAASKSVVLSATLSTVARPMMNVVPAHGARAPAAGSGKSYIFDIISAICQGETCPVISASEREEETEKRITSALLTGGLIINLDNVNGPLCGGDILFQLVDREILQPRVLGKSELVRVYNRHVLFFNGNNVRPKGDMTRRTLIADLDTCEERPAEREFHFDPVAAVKADRGKYIAACMTILRAYIAAGSPKQDFNPKNSFGEWSGLVRSAIVWLGREDPNVTADAVREDDPELQKLAGLMVALRPIAGQKQNAVSVTKIIELAIKLHNYGYNSPVYPALNEFAQNFAGQSGKPSPVNIGRWLSQNKGRVISVDIDGVRVRTRLALIAESRTGKSGWYVETLATEGGQGMQGIQGIFPMLRRQDGKKTCVSVCDANGGGEERGAKVEKNCQLGEEGRGTSLASTASPASLSTQPLFGEEDGAYDAPFVD